MYFSTSFITKEDRAEINQIIRNKIKTRTSYNLVKGKRKNEVITTYNQLGRVTSKKGKNYFNQYEYLNDTLLLKSTSVVKKKTYTTTLEYNTHLDITKIVRQKNDKITSEVNITYNSKNKILTRINRYGKNLKHTAELKYYYLNEDKLSKCEKYLDGKLDKIWTFTCDEKGKEVKQEIEESQQCTWNQEFNDGSYIRYSRTIEKDEIFLYKSYFTKDSVFYKSESFKNDSILKNRYEVQPNYTKWTIYKKDKILFTNIDLLQNGLVTSHLYCNNSFLGRNYSYTNTYNSQQLISEKVYYSNRKQQFHNFYEYTYY